MTNQVFTDASSFHRDPQSRGILRWLLAGLAVLILHTGFFAFLLHRQPPEPQGTSTDAVLVDLTPPASTPKGEVMPAKPPSVAAPDAAPPPSSTPTPEPPTPPPEPAPPPAITLPTPPVPVLPVLPKVAAPIEVVKPDPAEEARVAARQEAKKVEARRRKIAEQAEARREAAIAQQRRDDQRRRDEARQQAREQSRRKAAESRERNSQASAASAASRPSLGAWSGAVHSRVVGNASSQGGASGRATVTFSVSGAGRIGGVRVVSSSDGQAASAARSAVTSIGSVEPPPDHLSKNVTVSIQFQ